MCEVWSKNYPFADVPGLWGVCPARKHFCWEESTDVRENQSPNALAARTSLIFFFHLDFPTSNNDSGVQKTHQFVLRDNQPTEVEEEDVTRSSLPLLHCIWSWPLREVGELSTAEESDVLYSLFNSQLCQHVNSAVSQANSYCRNTEWQGGWNSGNLLGLI